ncbi:MAG: FKBP-type peptidyl-prolyl cis-trans isomerase [Limisphaerales bacterium]|jgi:FKBP-type peptidyl-prolyl cis-trans isomerase
MKTSTLVPILLLAFASVGFSADSAKEAKKKEQLGYALGVDLGKSFRQRQIDFDFDSFMRGFIDGLQGNRTELDPKQLETIKKEFNDEIAGRRKNARAERMTRIRELSVQNLEAAEKFFEANRKKPAVVELESGLQYLVLKEGEGPRPAEGDKLKLHYRGMFLDGQEFESTHAAGDRPIETELGKVSPGWKEALPLMQEGSKWRLFVPSKLGHGERGNPPMIGPNAPLIFELELLAVERK